MFIFKGILFLSGNLKQKAVKQALFAERDRADPPPGPAAPAAPAGPSLTRARGVGAAGPARAPPGAPERGCGDTAPPPGGAPRGQPNAGPAPHPATQTRPKHPFLPGETAARICCAVLLHGTATRFDTQPQKPTQRHPEPSGGDHAGKEHKHGKKEIILPNFFTCFTNNLQTMLFFLLSLVNVMTAAMATLKITLRNSLLRCPCVCPAARTGSPHLHSAFKHHMRGKTS